MFNPFHMLTGEPPPPGLTDGIEGWLMPAEEAALYALGAHAPGPLLEIGAWCGRSTVCLAAGLATRDEPVDFVTVELDPKIEQWPLVDGVRYFRPSLNEDALHSVGPAWEREIEPVVTSPGGVLGRLTANLAAAGVDHLVRVAVGDFRSIGLHHERFGFIFADVMHDEAEITRNVEHLARLLAPGALLACHDTTPANRELLVDRFDFTDEIQVESLFVGRVAG